MALFLLKPHVVGPEGNVTSPDVIVDRLFIDGAPQPVNRVTHDAWQQRVPGDTAAAGYAVMALGGGALLLPAVALASGPVVVSRMAWRLANLDAHIGEATLNGTTLSEIGLPEPMIEAAGGSGDALPRGFMLIRTAPGDTATAELRDPRLDRVLAHRVVFEDVAEDRWGGARPRPRYSVGPTQKEVPHFI
jgi:hypothetical protein